MSISWSYFFGQFCFIPTPTLTNANLPSQGGRVFIVTDGYFSLNKELAKTLYQHNGTVYIADRLESKTSAAIAEIKSAHPCSDRRVEFLPLNLTDLSTIKTSAENFLREEARLDVLTNGGNILRPPNRPSKTPQGHELQMGNNCLGSLPLHALPHCITPEDGGVEPQKQCASDMDDYAQSKAANVLLSRQYQALHSADGIVSNAFNPSNCASPERRTDLTWYSRLLTYMTSYQSVFGAYTMLYAGWSEEAGRKENWGKYVAPWGRIVRVRPYLGAQGEAGKLWGWCERETREYV
ncbi:short-chain alcohol dehydrogenase [Elasticomyces elasticus]|nr:short-chain alcohol dehydrogenase [Elasticomyces elasticus]KAK4980595.1 short-chain alcohol dehydrogenase [Elasticomyces elasticus]